MPPRRGRGHSTQVRGVRRNPARNRQPVRRPDSPVSYALTAHDEIDSSDSDTSSDHPFSLALEPAVNVNSRDSSVELLDDGNLQSNRGQESQVPPPPTASTLHSPIRGADDNRALHPDVLHTEMVFMRRVDAADLTFEERVEILIAEIHRLEGRSPAGQSASPVAALGSPIPDVNDDNEPETTDFLAPTAEAPLNGAALFYRDSRIAGLPNLCRSHPDGSPDHTIIHRLSESPGFLKRALEFIRQEEATFYVGTANTPVDVSNDFMRCIYGFRELGSLDELERPGDVRLETVTPTWASEDRTRLLAHYSQNEQVPVYVLYVYSEDAGGIWTEAVAATPSQSAAPSLPVAPTAPVSNLQSSTPTITSGAAGAPTTSVPAPATAAPAPGPAAGPPATADAVALYLQTRFADRLARIHHARTIPCGTGYRHCTMEKHVMAILNGLGVNLTEREFHPVTVDNGLSIGYDDVINVAGLNKSTFGGTRTNVGRAREARRSLARHFRERSQARWAAANEEEALKEMARKELLETFDALLGESDIDDFFLEDDSGSAKYRAITMSYEGLKTQTNNVLRP
ncbi:hypothetical protein B0H10DRAFT_2236818 [Mycena sp. CBHHK59/15]|nr:hypothetical protein B0H10DRAFT_2236818 [Mycena sp. CBHHK59/15]